MPCSLQVAAGRPRVSATESKGTQAQPAGHHDQPAAFVFDLAGPGAQQPGKRVLDHILGRADVPQHPEGQVDQVRAMLGPGLDDLLIVLVHGHAFSSRRVCALYR
jgi:hypothetical protein